jgi:hypothetical protein
VLARLEQHPLKREPARRLSLGALGDRRAGGPEALDQVVAHALELAEVEQPSPASVPLRD